MNFTTNYTNFILNNPSSPALNSLILYNFWHLEHHLAFKYRIQTHFILHNKEFNNNYLHYHQYFYLFRHVAAELIARYKFNQNTHQIKDAIYSIYNINILLVQLTSIPIMMTMLQMIHTNA